jgi:energy-coupling factor transport system ATP-binding protein
MLNNANISSYSNLERSQQIGYVFQNPDHQIFSKTVKEEVAFSPKLSGIPEKQLNKRVMDALESVGLEDALDSDPFLLTKGGRQRVAVASLLAAQCEILVFDEPTTGLDYLEIQSMMELVRQLNEGGKTIIMITHNMYIVAEYARRVVAMSGGTIIMDLPTRQAFAREDKLLDLALVPPPVTVLSNKLGQTLLSVDEFLDVIEFQDKDS